MPEIGEIKRGTEIGYSRTNKWVWSACLDCGKERWVQLAWDNPISLRCRVCSARTPDKIESSRKFMTGASHPQWKGGVNTRYGYVFIRLYPDNFFYPMVSHRRGYVAEHRLVMAKHLNRCLLSWEVVHHRNGIRNDNRLENLELLSSQSRHLSGMHIQSEIKKRDVLIAYLQNRIKELEKDRRMW